MTTFRSEEMLVALVAAGLVPWILWTVRRGLADARLPIGRAHVGRERRVAFQALLFFYIAAAMLCAVIAVDLLFTLGLRP
jgi:hypothetical protein